ncbi:MAG TPA: accessory factor UbiK family protein [Xanthomonadales bacterium]|nr:accessory factor UbiK family protein [Xanthomonadales bacterium]
MVDLGKIDEIVTRLSEAMPPGARRIQEDLETRFRAVLTSAFEKMDLVTREEFDIQTSVLERTRLKLEALEKQLRELEQNP